MRKRTVFDLCEHHAALGGGKRTAEIVCEGGPAYGPACSPQPCRILPGSDFFAESATDEVAAGWVRDWAINRQK